MAVVVDMVASGDWMDDRVTRYRETDREEEEGGVKGKGSEEL